MKWDSDVVGLAIRRILPRNHIYTMENSDKLLGTVVGICNLVQATAAFVRTNADVKRATSNVFTSNQHEVISDRLFYI